MTAEKGPTRNEPACMAQMATGHRSRIPSSKQPLTSGRVDQKNAKLTTLAHHGVAGRVGSACACVKRPSPISARWRLFLTEKSWRGYRPTTQKRRAGSRGSASGQREQEPCVVGQTATWQLRQSQATALPISTLHEDLAGLFWQRNRMFVATARRCRNAGVQQRKDRTDVFLNGDQRAPRLSCRSDH